MDEVLIGIAIIFGIIIVVVITWFVALRYQQKIYSEKIGSAEEKSRKIIDEALKVAETKKREALLEAKEENLKSKNGKASHEQGRNIGSQNRSTGKA